MGFGNFVDGFGTAINLPELGISEFFNGGKNTQNSGRISGQGINTVVKDVGVINGKGIGGKTPAKPTGNSGGGAARVPATSTKQSSGGVNNYVGGAGGYAAAAPAIDPAVIAQFDQSIELINDALGRTGRQLDIAQGNIGRQYQTSVNELTSAKKANEGNYKNTSTQNQQSLRTSRNAITDQQSSGLRGLLRQLGAYGAVGSDLDVASGVVTDAASQQRSGAGQTFAQNQQNLDTNWNNYLSEWANSKKKADDWKTSQLQNAESQTLSVKQDLLTQLADLRGRRAAAQGGNYAGGASGDLRAARGLSSRIDSLGKLNPTYTGNTPTYNAPELSSYVAPQQQQVDASSLANNATANPSLALLLGQLDQQDQRQPLF